MEMVSKPCQDLFLHPILFHSIIEKKENTGSQMGHTKKYIKICFDILDVTSPVVLIV